MQSRRFISKRSPDILAASKNCSGFTLIELIAVVVILGLLSAIGSSFFVSTINSYNSVQERSKAINHGRLVIEQITRQIRSALPNSVRVSASGNCIEFLPLLGGANYLQDVPDSENMAGQTSLIATAPYSLASGTPAHVSIAALDASEIYNSGTPAGRADIGSLGTGPTYTSISLANSHRFDRNSVTRRVFIAADPIRFCVIGTTIYEYSSYGFSTASLTDIDPGGVSSVMAENTRPNGNAFTVSQGTEDVNTSVIISLNFLRGSTQIDLRQKVLVRNVP